MTQIYFIRHGESESNIDGVFTGQLDIPLSEAGREQARRTAACLKDVPLAAVYSSDLSRAYETGKIIGEPHRLMAIPTPHLREINGGLWQGVRYEELEEQFPDSYGLWRRQIGLAKAPEGETVAALQQRVRSFVEAVVRTHPDQAVAIATHATPIRAMECLWLGVSLEEMHTIPWVSNASVTLVEYDAALIARVVRRDDYRHLEDLHTVLPGTV